MILHERQVGSALCLRKKERGDDAADLGVQIGDHGGVGVPMHIPGCVFVGVDVRLRGLIGCMWCKRRHVEEQRLRRVVVLDDVTASFPIRVVK